MHRIHAPAQQPTESEVSRVLSSFRADSEARTWNRSSSIMRSDSRSPSVEPLDVIDPATLDGAARRRSSDTSLAELSMSRINASSFGLVRSSSTGLLDTVRTARRASEGKRAQWKRETQVKLVGVREDFYATLVSSYSSWAFTPAADSADPESQRLVSEIRRDSICAATSYCVRVWSLQLGLEKIPNPDYAEGALPMYEAPTLYETPTCVAQSNLGFLLVAYQGGMVALRDILNKEWSCVQFACDAVSLFELTKCTDFKHGYANPWSAETKVDTHITHCVWAVNTPATTARSTEFDQSSQFADPPQFAQFTARPAAQVMTRCGRNVEGFIGDHLGRVFKFVVVVDQSRPRLKIVAAIPSEACHSESICSMALDVDEKRLCVGGADCMMRIWHHDYRNAEEPLSLEAEIPHFSAIRGVSFCPAMPRLLVTGGGRHDRILRIFHVNQEAALCEIKMPAQIVGVVFVSKLEAFVALGHSRVKKYWGLGKVVNVLSGKVLAEIPGDGYSLTALKTQSGFCVNTSLKDLITYSWEADAGVHRLSAAVMESAYRLSLPVAVLR